MITKSNIYNFLLIVILIVLANLTISAYAEQSIGNDIFIVYVETEQWEDGIGTFTIATGPEHTFPNENVFFDGNYGDAWSSYITIVVYDTKRIYVQSNHGDIPNSIGSFSVIRMDSLDPSIVSYTDREIVILWRLPEGLEVEQSIKVYGDTINNTFIEKRVVVRNVGSTPISFGLRFLWDIMIDGQDGAVVRFWNTSLQPTDWLYYESKHVYPINISYWQATNDPDNPVFYIWGSVTEPLGSTIPDEIVYAWWQKLFLNPWQVSIDNNDYIAWDDTAIAYYWYNRTLNPGSSLEFKHYILSVTLSQQPERKVVQVSRDYDLEVYTPSIVRVSSSYVVAPIHIYNNNNVSIFYCMNASSINMDVGVILSYVGDGGRVNNSIIIGSYINTTNFSEMPPLFTNGSFIFIPPFNYPYSLYTSSICQIIGPGEIHVLLLEAYHLGYTSIMNIKPLNTRILINLTNTSDTVEVYEVNITLFNNKFGLFDNNYYGYETLYYINNTISIYTAYTLYDIFINNGTIPINAKINNISIMYNITILPISNKTNTRYNPYIHQFGFNTSHDMITNNYRQRTTLSGIVKIINATLIQEGFFYPQNIYEILAGSLVLDSYNISKMQINLAVINMLFYNRTIQLVDNIDSLLSLNPDDYVTIKIYDNKIRIRLIDLLVAQNLYYHLLDQHSFTSMDEFFNVLSKELNNNRVVILVLKPYNMQNVTKAVLAYNMYYDNLLNSYKILVYDPSIGSRVTEIMLDMNNSIVYYLFDLQSYSIVNIITIDKINNINISMQSLIKRINKYMISLVTEVNSLQVKAPGNASTIVDRVNTFKGDDYYILKLLKDNYIYLIEAQNYDIKILYSIDNSSLRAYNLRIRFGIPGSDLFEIIPNSNIIKISNNVTRYVEFNAIHVDINRRYINDFNIELTLYNGSNTIINASRIDDDYAYIYIDSDSDGAPEFSDQVSDGSIVDVPPQREEITVTVTLTETITSTVTRTVTTTKLHTLTETLTEYNTVTTTVKEVMYQNIRDTVTTTMTETIILKERGESAITMMVLAILIVLIIILIIFLYNRFL